MNGKVRRENEHMEWVPRDFLFLTTQHNLTKEMRNFYLKETEGTFLFAQSFPIGNVSGGNDVKITKHERVEEA